MKKTFLKFFLILLVGSFVFSANAVPSANMLTNGGFESGDNYWYHDTDGTVNFFNDTVVHEGSKSCSIVLGSSASGGNVTCWESPPIGSTTHYYFAIWVYDMDNDFRIRLIVRNSGFRKSPNNPDLYYTSGWSTDDGWQELAVDGDSWPEIGLAFYCQFQTQAGGSGDGGIFYLDDLRMDTVPVAPELPIDPFYVPLTGSILILGIAIREKRA